MMRIFTLLLTVLLSIGCHDDRDHEGHGDHGHGHEHHEGRAGHEEHDDHDEQTENALAITRWAKGHELFVELGPLGANKPVQYHAHVTVLDGFKPVLSGELTVQFKQGDRVASEVKIDGVARPGIFVTQAKAPEAGNYALSMTYDGGDVAVAFDCGTVAIGKRVPEESPRPVISFLKEQQWRIPFGTELAQERTIAREIELPAIVEPAGTDRLTISAPTSGRFFHNPELRLAEGLHLKAGALVGRIAPTVTGDDFGRLSLDVDEARLKKDQAERELKRIEPLVADGLLPAKRLIEANNEIERHSAQLRAAYARLSRVVAPGGKGGLAVKASLAGVVTEVMVANGEPVQPGQSLLRIGGERNRWVRARFVARPDEPMHDARAVAIRTPGGIRVDIQGRARLLSSHPTVDPRTQLASFIAEVSAARPPAKGHHHGDETDHELLSGTHVILLIQVGDKTERLTVHQSAVVDINTRLYVFVQSGGEEFEKRRVTIGDRDGEFVQIVKGVEAGERVVTRGGYDIHLASVMGAVESHRH